MPALPEVASHCMSLLAGPPWQPPSCPTPHTSADGATLPPPSLPCRRCASPGASSWCRSSTLGSGSPPAACLTWSQRSRWRLRRLCRV